MTKGELLRELAPFTDELKLYIDTGDDVLYEIGLTRFSRAPDGAGVVRLIAVCGRSIPSEGSRCGE